MACGAEVTPPASGSTGGTDANDQTTGVATTPMEMPSSEGSTGEAPGSTTDEDDEDDVTGSETPGINAEFVVSLLTETDALTQRYYRIEDGVPLPPVDLYDDDLAGSWSPPTFLSARRGLFRVSTPQGGQVRIMDFDGPFPATSVRVDARGIDGRFFVVEADESVLYAHDDSMYRVSLSGIVPARPLLLAQLPALKDPRFPFPFEFGPVVDPQGRYALSRVVLDGERAFARVALDGSSVTPVPESWSLRGRSPDGDTGFFVDLATTPSTLLAVDLSSGVGPGTPLLTSESIARVVPRPGPGTRGVLVHEWSGETERTVYVGLQDGVPLPPLELPGAVKPNPVWLIDEPWSADGTHLLLFGSQDAGLPVWIANFGLTHEPELIPLHLEDAERELLWWGIGDEAVYVRHRRYDDNLGRLERTFVGEELGQVFAPVFPPYFTTTLAAFDETGETLLMTTQLESGQGAAAYAVDVSSPIASAPVRLSVFPDSDQRVGLPAAVPGSRVVAYSMRDSSGEPSVAQLLAVDLDNPDVRLEFASNLEGLWEFAPLPRAE